MKVKLTTKRWGRRAVMGVGRRLGPSALQRISTAHGYLELGSWTAATFEGKIPDRPHREDVFAALLQRVHGSQPLYLEFGVFEGASMRWFSDHLVQPAARLVGFDSFEGLPENWNGVLHKGDFAVEGIPVIDDDRVSLIAGWFHQTLPVFELPQHDQLIVNMDADLYSSTAFVLDQLAEQMGPGTLVYFDEFNDRDHEQRALREFMSRTDKNFRPIVTAAGGSHWLFEVTK